MSTLFRQQEFWNWLYSLGEVVVANEFWQLLHKEGQYQTADVRNQETGELYDWKSETLQFDFPITATYGLTSLLLLHGKCSFEEILYLRVQEKYYRIGWFDCHNHEMVFRQAEFEQLLHFIEQQASSSIPSTAYVLYLARFCPLLTTQQATQLMKKAIIAYSQLCAIESPFLYAIKKEELYTRKTEHGLEEIIHHPHRIEADGCPLNFIINEDLQWIKQEQGRYHLEGKAAHTLRSAVYDDFPVLVMQLYDEETTGHSSFPYQHWHALLQEITPS